MAGNKEKIQNVVLWQEIKKRFKTKFHDREETGCLKKEKKIC